MAWKCEGWLKLDEYVANGTFREAAPLGGSIGKDGDCLCLVGVQNDMVHGKRRVEGAHNAMFVINQILLSMEGRLTARWCIAVAKDDIPGDHCLFQDRLGRQGRAKYCINGSPGSRVYWKLAETLSHIRSLVPKRIVLGFKSYHEQIHSPSAFQYTKEVLDELRDLGLHRDRDTSRLVAKLLVYTGCIAPYCSGLDVIDGVNMSNMNVGPDMMALIPNGSSVQTMSFHEAVLASLAKKQIRRLFVAGLPLEEDVIDTAVAAKERKIVSDVYIILDACRAEDPLNSEAMAKVASLINTHGLKVTTYRYTVFNVPKHSLHAIKGGGVAVFPHAGQGDYTQIYCPESRAKSQNLPAEDQSTRRVVFNFGEADETRKGPPIMKAFGTDTLMEVVNAAPEHREYLVANSDGEWDPTIPDAPAAFIPAKYRLGTSILQWLGRDESRSVEWKHGIPGIAVRTRFPTGLASLTMVLGGVANQTTNMNADPVLTKMYGNRSFQLACEGAMSIVSSCSFITQHTAMVDVRRVLQKMVTVKTVTYFTMRQHFPLADVLDASADTTTKLVVGAEKHYADVRGSGNDEEKAEALWMVDRLAEQAADWKAELFLMQQAGSWLEARKGSLSDGWTKRDLDMILKYSISELASFCCTKVIGHLLTISTNDVTNQLEPNKGEPITIVTAASPNFTSRHAGPGELGKYFYGDAGDWLPTARYQYKLRMTQTWRCVLSAFQQNKMDTISLTPLGCRPQDLTNVPQQHHAELVRLTMQALFVLLEEAWSFGQVYIYAGAWVDLLKEEVKQGYVFLCSVVVHVRDAKGVCRQAGLDGGAGHKIGLLCIGSVESVMLGIVGGNWEKGTEEKYSDEEDLANTTTILLSHIGIRPKGLESETVAFHTDTTPIHTILGPPGTKPWYPSSTSSPVPEQTTTSAVRRGHGEQGNALSRLMEAASTCGLWPMGTIRKYVMLSCAVALLVVLTTSTVNVPTAEENVPKTPVPTREFSLKCVDVEVPTEIEPLEEKEGNAAIRKAVNDVRTQRVDGKGGGDRWGGTFGPVVVMTYAACHGAVSQHYGHLSAMTIASLTKPDVMVLPHGRTRKTYKSRNVLAKLNTTNSLQNASHDPRIEWTEIPLSRVYRLDTFQRLLGGNTTVLNSPNPPGPVTLPSNFSGYERYWVPGKNEKFGLNASIVEMRYKRRRSGWVWKEMINRAVLAHWRAQVVIVDLGCTDIMVSANPGKKYGMVMQEDIKLLKKAHQTLQLAPYLRRVGRAAMGAVRKIQPEGGKYTGLHLRMERDMFEDKSVTRWKNMYLRAKEYFLDDKKEHPLLIASGIFEYMKRDELRQHLLPYSNTHDLYHLCLSRPLDNDIRPWIDFQVLATADYFQGHDYSSLSWLVVQQRILHALPLSTSSLVRRVIPARSPLCCENDRCLSTVCPLPNGTLLDYGSIVTEVAYELPPAVLDIAVK